MLLPLGRRLNRPAKTKAPYKRKGQETCQVQLLAFTMSPQSPLTRSGILIFTRRCSGSVPWPTAVQGLAGAGEVVKTAFSIPVSSLDYWQQRLGDHRISAERKGKRFDEEVLAFPDPDGMKIEIVGDADSASVNAPRSASVPPEHAIRGLFGVTLSERRLDETAVILKVMGFKQIAVDGNRRRFAASGNALGNHIECCYERGLEPGRQENCHGKWGLYRNDGAGPVVAPERRPPVSGELLRGPILPALRE
jgi:catechol 2,3-dioxygenase-like lactoylglutathione lyase family enzyme